MFQGLTFSGNKQLLLFDICNRRASETNRSDAHHMGGGQASHGADQQRTIDRFLLKVREKLQLCCIHLPHKHVKSRYVVTQYDAMYSVSPEK